MPHDNPIQPHSHEEQTRESWRRFYVFTVYLLKFLSITSLSLCVLAIILVLNEGLRTSNMNDLQKFFVLLSCAGFVIYCCVGIIAEFGFQWFLRQFHFLHFYLGRGCYLLWLGTELLASSSLMATSVGVQHARDMQQFAAVIGWILLSVGVIYIVFGFCCFQKSDDADADHASDPIVRNSEQSPVIGIANTILLANMALALGMTTAETEKKFGGESGSSEAEKYAKKRMAADVAYDANANQDRKAADGTESVKMQMTDDELEAAYYKGTKWNH